MDKKIETIEVPSDYKNLFLRIIENFSANEVENKIFVDSEDFIAF